MICEKLDPENWRLSFTEPEAAFIVNVMMQLRPHYQDDLARLPPLLRAYWQGSIARPGEATREALAESQEMLTEARAELRSERLALVEAWIREYELTEERDPWRVEVSTAERDEFVAMLNDRRLLLGLESGITQEDMEGEIDGIASEAKRATVNQIEDLAYFILMTLGPQIYRP